VSVSSELVLPDKWRSWTPAAQEQFLERLRQGNIEGWRPFYCTRPACDGNHHITVNAPGTNVCVDGFVHRWALSRDGWVCVTETKDEDGEIVARCTVTGEPDDEWLWPHARHEQHPPIGTDWLTWLLMAGRGAGKTRAGSEWTHRIAKAFPGCRIALISPTAGDVRDTIIEGESGLQATARPGEYPEWEPSKKKLTWPNGTTAYGYSGDEPDRLRGKQHHFGWLDEPAHMPLITEVWSNFMFGLRLGASPKICLTTSPLPIPWLKKRVAKPTTRLAKASSYANIRNLPAHYREDVLSEFEGTRTGRQEIDGHILEDVEGALWTNDLLEKTRFRTENGEIGTINDLPDMDRILVGVDPAGTARAKSDETGILVGGVADDECYLWADYSGRYSPDGWAGKALFAYDTWDADAIVIEITYGRDMVTAVMEAHCRRVGRTMPRLILVDSRRGKVIRAEPVVALYERDQVHHVGILEKLEDQQTTWVPGQKSPDRIDAAVHLLTEAAHVTNPSAISTPYDRADDVEDELTRRLLTSGALTSESLAVLQQQRTYA
jgi:phage terminase large subunit-like protein